MWLAHALTLSRIPIALALWATYGDLAWSLTLLALAALTDTADGNVARWMQRHGRTRPAIGGWLDPLVDKIFVAIVLAAIWLETRDTLVIALVGARELVLGVPAALYLALRGPARELHADALGKLATVAQFIALAAIFGAPRAALPAAAAAALLGLAAAVHYAVVEVRLRRVRHLA